MTWNHWLQKNSTSYQTVFESGCAFELLVDSQRFIPRMLQMIQNAKEFVGHEFFDIEADEGGLPFAEALLKAKMRGLDVKMIFDVVEMSLRTNARWSFHPFIPTETLKEKKETRRLVDRLELAGIDIVKYGWKHALRRNHAKLLVADGTRACVGGFNPTAHNKQWHEVCAYVEGPIVNRLIDEFNWMLAKYNREPFPNDRDPVRYIQTPKMVRCTMAAIANRAIDGKFNLTRFLFDALDQARESIWIENGYVAHKKIFKKLIECAERGVKEIHIIVPHKTNHRSVDVRLAKWLPDLKSAGIQVHPYQGMTHAKAFLIDDVVASIGSLNLEEFSLSLSNELNVVAVDEDGHLAAMMKEQLFYPDIADSTRLKTSA